MKPDKAYPVPARTVGAEMEIKRSRFIATVGKTGTADEARAFIEKARTRHPGARHHCWAFVAGPPVDGTPVGMSDDGEPGGTAGKPMLHLLQKEGIGEVAAVVSRYFGGIKLGTGGLVRAYAGTLKRALNELPMEQVVPTQSIRITLPYAHENGVRRLLMRMRAKVVEARFGEQVEILAEVPKTTASEVQRRIHDETRGTGSIIE